MQRPLLKCGGQEGEGRMKSSGIGGQAVLEGIMMKNHDDYAVAVRSANHEIVTEKRQYKSLASKWRLFRLPFIRGIFSFIDSMILGMKTLSFSANIYAQEEEPEEPSRLEAWLTEKMGEKFEKIVMGLTMAISIVLAVAIFMMLPAVLSSFLKPVLPSLFWQSVLEGVIRVAIFMGYISLISLMKDIRRVYMYHGAEHKCINCIEHGLPLNAANVAKSSRFHKRCGTSFLIFVVLISVILFIIIRVDTLWLRLATRVLLIPVIAGISYEILKLAGNSDHPLVNLISKPGLWVQRLTTKEPTEDMIEVAIRAVEEVFDWKSYLKQEFHIDVSENQHGLHKERG